MSGSQTIGDDARPRKAASNRAAGDIPHLQVAHEATVLTFQQGSDAIEVAWRHVLHGIDLGLAVDGLAADQASTLHRMRRGAVLLAGERRPLRALGDDA